VSGGRGLTADQDVEEVAEGFGRTENLFGDVNAERVFQSHGELDDGEAVQADVAVQPRVETDGADHCARPGLGHEPASNGESPALGGVPGVAAVARADSDVHYVPAASLGRRPPQEVIRSLQHLLDMRGPPLDREPGHLWLVILHDGLPWPLGLRLETPCLSHRILLAADGKEPMSATVGRPQGHETGADGLSNVRPRA
jgi:hypothetical protein